MRKLMIMASILLAATPLQAQQLDLSSLDKLADRAKDVVRLDLDESMMKTASGLLNSQKPGEAAAKKAVEGLKGFFLRAFEFNVAGSFNSSQLKPLRDQLKAPAWTRFFQAKEGGEEMEMWMHKTNGATDGFLLIAAEDNELLVINAMGISNLQDFTNVSKQFGGTELPINSK